MKHISDHRELSTGARLAHFIRLARDRSESAWKRVWKQPRGPSKSDRRMVEYTRIERGREI